MLTCRCSRPSWMTASGKERRIDDARSESGTVPVTKIVSRPAHRGSDSCASRKWTRSRGSWT